MVRSCGFENDLVGNRAKFKCTWKAIHIVRNKLGELLFGI